MSNGHLSLQSGLTPRLFTAVLYMVLAAAATPGLAATFTVVNNCSYTIYPGIYPASYSNGGWQMNPGTSVSFTLAPGWNGRIWGRTGCNNASPAVCTTGQCGGTGLQCAGTTGVAGTSLAEFNLNADGTDWYNVSYVDGFDNPIGIRVSNSSCVSPNTCTTAPLQFCSADLLTGNGRNCLSPCTRYNTDQYCCRGAFGTAQTCVVGNWSASAQSYVNNIHASCPNQYSYAYDEISGNALHTCPTGANYTVTFCPTGGGSGAQLNGPHTLTPQNATGMRLDDYLAGTGSGNPIVIYTANNTGAQTWVFSNVNVVPAGYYNLAVSLGPYCMTAAGSTANSAVNLQPCNGSPGQAWNAIYANGTYELRPANNTNLCLDVKDFGTTDRTSVIVWNCTGASNQRWAIN
jgi:hypothetical protein